MKTISKDNIRVEVEPGVRGYSYNNDDEKIRDCKEIVEQINRHVDSVASCSIEWDTVELCSFCGFEWDTDNETGEPYCCAAAVEEWEINEIPLSKN